MRPAERSEERTRGERQRLESLIAELATSLIDLAVDEIDVALESALRRIGETLGFDRCHVFELADDGSRFEIRHSYTEPGVPRSPLVEIGPEWPWFHGKIVRGETIAVDGLPGGVPEDAEAERIYAQVQGLRAGIAMPLVVAGKVVGLVAFGSTRPRPLPAPLRQHLGTVAKIFGNALARRQSERALRASEERYRALVENAPEAIVVFDAEAGRFVEANGNAEQLFGHSRKELLELGLWDISPPIQPDGTPSTDGRRMIEQALAGETPVFEWWHRRSDGVQFPTEVRLLRVPPTHRKLVRGSVTDISERRQLEQQLLHSQKMDAVGQLAGGVAHDFNNLLTAITGNAELLLDEAEEESLARHALQEIQHACEKAAGLTRQLLTFSRRQETVPEILEVNGVIDGLARMLRRMIGAEIEMKVDLDPSCGRVEVDPTQLEQVLINLVINARDAMPRGGLLTLSTRRATIAGERAGKLSLEPGEYSCLEVSDDGAGIPLEIQAKIFEPFFTTKDQGKGTGLGLATVYGIVRQAGGAIELESYPDEGTTFRVWLPTTVAAAATARGRSQQTAVGTETILLVEDERMVRQVALRSLVNAGYRVLEATDGRDALRVAGEHDGTIDILVTDVVMPGLRGPELARELHNARPSIAVLLVSGYADDWIKGSGDGTTPYPLLQKPYGLAELTNSVREVLDARR